MNDNIETIIKYLDLAETLGTEEVVLKGFEIRVLNDHLRTLYEQKRQLSLLIKYLNKEIENMNEELESLEL